MKLRAMVIVATMGLVLSGCAGLDAAEEYSDVDHVSYAVDGSTWWIWDKPRESRVMVSPNPGRSMGQGFWSGLTLGAADTEIPKPQYQRVVEAWLARTGRRCAILDGYKLIKPQWEFKYRC
jgi:hypothetical protein